MNKPTTPTFNFITPANVFGLVRSLQSGSRNKSLGSDKQEVDKIPAPSTSDPDIFQSLLNVSRNQAQRSV
jgi:hypothetical protein